MSGVRVDCVHRTRLNADGTAARDARGKRVKTSLGRPHNGMPIVAAPWDELGRGLCVAEGIEDAMRLHEATGLAAWAGGSASFMGKLAPVVPSHVETVIIAEDDNDTGRRATRKLAEELRTRGIEIFIWSGGHD